MPKVYAMAANGTEECELFNVVDVLRRAGAVVEIVSIDGEKPMSSHGVTIVADRLIDSVDLADCDILFVPGGMPGSERLGACAALIDGIEHRIESGKRVAAICAAPAVVLGEHGFLRGKRATCFPGFEARMNGAVVTGARVETDGLITTARGLGCAIELGLELIKILFGEEKAEEIKRKIQF